MCGKIRKELTLFSMSTRTSTSTSTKTQTIVAGLIVGASLAAAAAFGYYSFQTKFERGNDFDANRFLQKQAPFGGYGVPGYQPGGYQPGGYQPAGYQPAGYQPPVYQPTSTKKYVK